MIVVEFQPGRSPGTYVNVGAMWLWTERVFWAFDEGCRLYWRDDATFVSEPPLGEGGWRQQADFLNTDQFTRDVALAVKVAAARVTELRTQLPDVAAVAARLTGRPTRLGESPLWHAFHSGAAAALSGDLSAAARSLTEVVSADLQVEWEHDLAAEASELLGLMNHPVALRRRLVETIGRSRHMLKLPAADLDSGCFGLR